MLADPAIRSLPGPLGLEERRPECLVGRGRGDCDAAHEILKTNMKTIIYQSYDIIVSIYQVYTWYTLLSIVYIRCMLGISHIHVHMEPLTSQ